MRKNKKRSSKETDIVSPKVDFCFKELMEDSDIRKGFVAVILSVQPEEIEQTRLIPTHLRKQSDEEKLGILDVRVMLADGIQIDFEIQVAPYPWWPERSVFYLAKMYTEQMEVGEDYKTIKKCIHVGILDFKLFPEDKEWYSCFHLWEDGRRRQYTDKLEVHIFELPKLNNVGSSESELLDWMRFMNAEKKEEFEMLAAKNKYLGKAYGKLKKLSADKEWRLEYEARQKAIWDYNSMMKYNYEKGEIEGYERGELQGKDLKLKEQIRKKLEKQKNAEQIAEELEEELSVIEELILAMKQE